jgi:hypothetical protein
MRRVVKLSRISLVTPLADGVENSWTRILTDSRAQSDYVV